MRLAALGFFLLLAACTQTLSSTPKASRDSGERVTWQSVVCTGQPVMCSRMEAVGWFFAQPGATSAVLVTHGSQGLDLRLFEYADSLRAAGFAALVIDHWTPRGIGVTHNDYAAAALKGGNEFNMTFDSLTAAAMLRERGFTRIGSIGESQGGAAALYLVQRWMHDMVARNVTRLYGKPFTVTPLDAVVGLYPYCGFRHAVRDAYVATPLLLITGAEDDETPSRYCERYIPWMNARGGKGEIVVLPGVGHSFDAPYRRRFGNGPHYANCDILVEENRVTELNSGRSMAGQDTRALFAQCLGHGYHSGYLGDRFVAVPRWTDFFRRNL